MKEEQREEILAIKAIFGANSDGSSCQSNVTFNEETSSGQVTVGPSCHGREIRVQVQNAQEQEAFGEEEARTVITHFPPIALSFTFPPDYSSVEGYFSSYSSSSSSFSSPSASSSSASSTSVSYTHLTLPTIYSV